MLNPDVEGNRARTWEAFSNHEAGKGNSVVSIESWHDSIHLLVGTGNRASGHMAKSQVAGVRFSSAFLLRACC